MADTLGRSGEHQVEPRPLHEPILRFDLAREAEALRQEAPWRDHGHNAKTIARYDDLRIVLVVLDAGRKWEEHHTDERISLQTIAGNVRVTTPNHRLDLPAGGLLTLDRDIPHEVLALVASELLLTIAWVRRH